MTTITDSSDRTLVRVVLLVLAVLVFAPILAMTLAAPMMGTMGHWGSDGGMIGVAPWWGLGMGLVWLAILGLVGYALYRAFVGTGAASGDTDAAIEELRLAYARGDLTDEEYESRRAVLATDRSDEP